MIVAGPVAEPCKRPCLHRECRRRREEANDRCHLCREAIGFGRARVVQWGGPTLHWSCVVEATRRQGDRDAVEAAIRALNGKGRRTRA